MLFRPIGFALPRATTLKSGFGLGALINRLPYLLLLLLTSVTMALALMPASVAQAEEEFLDPKVAFVFSAAMVSPTQVDVHFKIAPKYYMYRERFEFALAPDAAPLGEPVYPKGIVKYDPTFERDLEVYHRQVTVRLPLNAADAAGAQPLTLAVTSQGCADAGLCYPPMTSEVQLLPVAGGYALSGAGVVDSVPAPRDELPSDAAGAADEGQALTADLGFGSALGLGDVGFASYLGQAGWLQVVALCLALGVLLSFTPCVLPMVPILLAIVAGKSGAAGAAGGTQRVSRWRGLSLAASYVLGMSLVYTALGVAAGLIGASLAVWLQTPWVLTVFAVLLALFALAMFDVFTLQAPTGMQSWLNAKVSKIPGGHYSGAFLMGMLSALIVGPCVAAPLAGVLLFISQTGDVTLGGTALFALAWGEGLLLLVVGATSGALLPKAGPWMGGIKRLFGILLLGTAWWMLNSVLPDWILMLGWAFLALWSAVMLGAFESLASGSADSGSGVAAPGAGRYLRKTLGLILALWAVMWIVGLSAGGRDLFRPLAPFSSSGRGFISSSNGLAAGGLSGGVAVGQGETGPVINKDSFTRVYSVAELDNLLANANRPVMLDFYADWCVSCLEMEKFTFTDPKVAQQMSQLLLVQADVTKNTEDDRALLKRFNLFGPPGIIFFDQQGAQLSQARVVGFKNAKDFSAVLEQVLATADDTRAADN